MLDATHKEASRVMYYFAFSISDQLLNHIRDAKTPKEAWTNLRKVFAAPKEAWTNLRKVFAARNMAKKLQLR